MPELSELAREVGLSSALVGGVLVFARVAPLVFLVPFLGGPAISAGARVIVSLAVTAVVLPTANTASLAGLDSLSFLVFLGKEALVGFSLGLLAAVAFHTLAMAGQLVDHARGAQHIEGQGVLAGGADEGSPLASLHFQLGVVLFLLLGGHRAFLVALAGSYEIIPLTHLPLAPEGLRAIALATAQLVGAALAAALLLAAPAITAIFLTDIALGLLGRAAPRLGSWFLAMPLRAVVGLALALLALTFVIAEIGPALGEAGRLVTEAAGRLRGAPN